MELQIIQNRIYEIRGVRVMLDFDLATLYQVETRALKQAVRRNIDRFPEDFMFKLSSDEANYLITIGISQNVIPPGYNVGASEVFAFTQEGVAMLSGVLRSPIATQVNIGVMRAFVALRQMAMLTIELTTIKDRLRQLERADEDTLESVNDLSEDLRKDIDNIYLAIGALSAKTPQIEKPRRPIGYQHLGKKDPDE